MVVACVSALASSVPVGTPLHVRIDRRTAMSVGQKIEGRTTTPIYVGTEIVVPVGSAVSGTVSGLTPDAKARRSARFDGDFTPLRIPVIQFTSLTLPDKQTVALSAAPATRGAPRVKILSVPAKHESLARQLYNQGLLQFKQAKESITAPGKKERLTDFFYGQLPYHPQRILRDTEWSFDLTAPLEVTADASWQPVEQPDVQSSAGADLGRLHLHAYLTKDLTSADAANGEHFDAVVTQPLFAADHSVEVPVGSVLVGQVTEAEPARHFGRDGKLRFVFRELRRPEGEQTIEGTVTAAVADKSAAVALDSEGGFRPAPRNRLVSPLVLGILGSQALDGEDEQRTAKNAVASNGFGLVGRIAGAASGSSNVATGFGMYALAVSVYRNYIARGKNVSFARGTQIEIDAVPSHGAKLPIH
jgi:hypothetical protein